MTHDISQSRTLDLQAKTTAERDSVNDTVMIGFFLDAIQHGQLPYQDLIPCAVSNLHFLHTNKYH